MVPGSPEARQVSDLIEKIDSLLPAGSTIAFLIKQPGVDDLMASSDAPREIARSIRESSNPEVRRGLAAIILGDEADLAAAASKLLESLVQAEAMIRRLNRGEMLTGGEIADWLPLARYAIDSATAGG